MTYDRHYYRSAILFIFAGDCNIIIAATFMENFIVSARKYRPATFDMVVGQDSITSTLKNAIRNNYLAQAYLFCGPRGVGKTTCARIFAKTINCSNLNDKVEPCNKCESCMSFNTLRSLNIHELDAASNNKVEDIRTLTDLVRIPPQIGKYSIYIIDEVHMLSSSAFNAFLKTLEEPPAHAIFILATTEKHKIIPTILSRCQIFDFNRIRTDEIVLRLKYVGDSEKIEYEEEALHVIAVKADGALRDALSIFDQLISYGSGKITYRDVIDNLNMLDYDYYFRVVEATLEGDYGKTLLIFNEILDNGFDGHNFIAGLGSHLRDLLVSRDETTVKLLETAPAIRDRYRGQASKCSVNFLFRALDVCNSCDLAYKTSRNQRLLVEIAMLRLSMLNQGAGQEENPEKKKNEPDSLNVNSAPNVSGRAAVPGSPAENDSISDRSVPEKKEVRQAGTKTLSLKDALANGVNEPLNKPAGDMNGGKAHKPAQPAVTGQPFTEASFIETWKEFALTIRNETPRIAGQLLDQTPALPEDNNIRVTLSNSALKEEFDRKYRYFLQEHFNRKFAGRSFTIETGTEESEQQTSVYYTDEQKFAYLANKNPALKELRKSLNLDFE